MNCVTKLDKAAQKVLSKSLFLCFICAFILGVFLIFLWGLLCLIDDEPDILLFVVAFAPILFGIIVLVHYIKTIKSADGEKSYNTYDFGERVVNVRAVRGGVFRGSADIDYVEIKKVKRCGRFLLLYVNKMGAFIVDTDGLGTENTAKLVDNISLAKTKQVA